MTAPNPTDSSAPDPDPFDQPADVWTPTMLRPAPKPTHEALPATTPATTPTPPSGGAGVAWHQIPDPPEPPWRSGTRSRMVALNGGRGVAVDAQTSAELARLREEAASANDRVARQRALLDQLDRQLAEARRQAAAEGLAARTAERRVAELNHELAVAQEALERLQARDLDRTEQVVARIDDHHRSLVASLRSDATTGSDGAGTAPLPGWSLPADRTATDIDPTGEHVGADAATASGPNPTLVALRHWLTPDDAMLVVDGDALADALRADAATGAGDTTERRSAAVAALRAGLRRQAPRAAVVFDGSISTDAPDEVRTDPDLQPRVLVTAPGVDLATAVGALIGRDVAGPIVLAHEAVAATGVIAAPYRLGIDALATALSDQR